MKTDDFDPSGEVLLVGDGAGATDSPGGGILGHVAIVRHGANEVAIDVDAQQPCYLVVSDVYYPGWRAYVDGSDADILGANYAFRAVRLRPGSRAVRMEYTSLHFRLGTLFTIAGLALVAVLVSYRCGSANPVGG